MLEIAAHIIGQHVHVLHEMFSHLLHTHHVAQYLTQLVAHLADALLLVFLKFLPRPTGLYPIVNTVVHLLHDICLGDLYTVDICLIEKELLHSQLFGNTAIRISLPMHALLECLHTRCLHI